MEFDKLVFGRFGAQEFDRFGAEDSLADLVPIIILYLLCGSVY